MITCKEDMINTWIVNDMGELRGLYISKAKSFGFIDETRNAGLKFIGIFSEWDNCEVIGSTSGLIGTQDLRKQVTLSDFKKEKPKRTKVEYVKCEFSREWEAVKHYNEEGELFVIDCNGNYSNVNDISGAWYEVVCKNYDSLFIRIETEIDWRDEAVSYFNATPSLHEDDKLVELIGRSATKQERCAFVKLCHLVAELTDKPTN